MKKAETNKMLLHKKGEEEDNKRREILVKGSGYQ